MAVNPGVGAAHGCRRRPPAFVSLTWMPRPPPFHSPRGDAPLVWVYTGGPTQGLVWAYTGGPTQGRGQRVRRPLPPAPLPRKSHEETSFQAPRSPAPLAAASVVAPGPQPWWQRVWASAICTVKTRRGDRWKLCSGARCSSPCSCVPRSLPGGTATMSARAGRGPDRRPGAPC